MFVVLLGFVVVYFGFGFGCCFTLICLCVSYCLVVICGVSDGIWCCGYAVFV